MSQTVAGSSDSSDAGVSVPHPTASQILDAARHLFAEQGYDATSVAGIAEQVGVVEGAVYRHFPGKRDLLNRVIRSFYEPLIDSARAGVADIASPREQVRFLIRHQLRAMVHDTRMCRLIISEARAFDDYHTSEVADLNRRYTSLLTTAFRSGVEQGEFRRDLPAELVRDLVYGSIEHITWSALSGREGADVVDPDVTAEQLMSVLCRGIDEPVVVPHAARSDGGALPSLAAELRRLATVADGLDATSVTDDGAGE